MIDLNWPYAWGGPCAQAQLKSSAADFVVEEWLDFEPEGQGEHLWLYIEKTGLNTDEVVKCLGKWAHLPFHAIGFSGLKDKHAVTRQWFSLHLPGKADPELALLERPELKVLRQHRHPRKLKRGVHKGNRFHICLRELQGDLSTLQQRLAQLQHGVPNYFGEQRFGRDGYNLSLATPLFAGELTRLSRHKRGLVLSAVRSYLFNQILAERVRQGSWQQLQVGDVAMLAGTQSIFAVAELDDSVISRNQQLDIYPTAPLPGSGNSQSQGEVFALESAICQQYSAWLQGLLDAGLKQERRALVSIPQQLSWQLDADSLSLSFSLARGSFATAVIRELCTVQQQPFLA
ncbi:tRNA pseudouridine(13) synthase TruD [Balneatrix alpica]|uniref:tRNA pseudouridine(13) synthase TruD n=1 Tax=Balneatrix alpica TaxID=75684 RepID=UPI0027384481|nr:tRNA pseudouridine(13) synthase TruD [Balneatrix alpica]